MKSIVRVTSKFIVADRHCAKDCPVFHAMKAAGIPVKGVHAGWWIDEHDELHQFPYKVIRWIYEYDTSQSKLPRPQIDPIEFEVEWENEPAVEPAD